MSGKKESWIRRLVIEDDGMESVEIAFSIGLIAAIAGFGMIFLGDALNTFFNDAGSGINTAAFPNQGGSTTLGGSGGGS
jgi:Flp pilus assembly pilin Flp